MGYDPNNLFAKIIRKEVNANVIFETEHSLAILDAFPCAKGHSLLLPKADVIAVEELEALSDEFRAGVMKDLARLCRVVREGLKDEGVTAINTVANSLPHSGQIIPHVHFHVIPRKKDDRLLQHPKPYKNTMLTADEAQPVLAAFKNIN